MEVVRGEGEVLVVGERVEAGWEEHAPGLDPVEGVSALIVERRLPIR